MSDLTYQPQGWMHALGVALEAPSAYGVFVPPTSWFEGESAIERNPGYKMTDHAVGTRDAAVVSQYGTTVQGNLKTLVVPGRCTELMSMLCYGYVIPGEDEIGINHLQPISIYEKHSDELAYEIGGAVAETFNLRCAPEGDLTAEIDIVAHSKDLAMSPQMPNTAGDLAAFIGQNLVVTVDTTPVPAWQYSDCGVKFSHNLRKDRWGNDLLLHHIPAGPREIEIDLDLEFLDTGWRDRWNSGDEFGLGLEWTRGAYSVGLEFPRCRVLSGGDPKQATRAEDLRIKPTIRVLGILDGSPACIVSVDGVPLEGAYGY